MNSFFANVFDNPILLRELRRRMRGKALIYSIITYIVLMTISTVLVLLVTSPSPFAEASVEMLQQMQLTGERIFLWITGIQILLVLIVAPTLTAGMTTGEKERKTFDFLRVTTITRWMYVMGCFLSTAFYVALALICALPLLSLSFIYGGVTLDDVIRMFFYLLAGSFILSSFGLFISSVTDRTRTAQGIVVFLIFAILFGGFILYQQIQIIFAGAAASAQATGAGAGTGGQLFIFNYGIPSWVMTVLSMLLVTAIFLLLAARKLFEPEDVRAFSHSQFALLFAGGLIGGLGILSANSFSREIPELAFLAVGYSLLLVAASCFAVGRMEVGDEIWHLKRLLPFLRPIDQTVPFLILVGAGWYWALGALPGILGKMNVPAGLVDSMTYVSLSSFAFFCLFARAVTGLTHHRNRAGRYLLICLSVFLVGLPIIGAGIGALVTPFAAVGREIIAFSPFAMLVDAFANPAAYQPGGYTVGTVASVVYVVLALGIGLYGETKRYLRWKDFDYHFDMPAA